MYFRDEYRDRSPPDRFGLPFPCPQGLRERRDYSVVRPHTPQLSVGVQAVRLVRDDGDLRSRSTPPE